MSLKVCMQEIKILRALFHAVIRSFHRAGLLTAMEYSVREDRLYLNKVIKN